MGIVECDRSEESRRMTQNHTAAQLEGHLPVSSQYSGSFQRPSQPQPPIQQILGPTPISSFSQHRRGSKMRRPTPITTFAPFAYQISEPTTPFTSMSSSFSPQSWSQHSSPGIIGQEREYMREGGPLLPRVAYGARNGHQPSVQLSGVTGVHHNIVNTERVRRGLDVRTTVRRLCLVCCPQILTMQKIMLRNIPNKIQQADLKRILDESSFGKYDFMYLRIGECTKLQETLLGATGPLTKVIRLRE